jgi:predicted NBD/HSP70 family sugar kinase
VSTASPTTQLVCVEIGGGGVETVLLDEDGTATRLDGLAAPAGLPLLIAVPGIIEDGRVVIASNLGWYDVDPAAQLGLPAPAALVGIVAETAALGVSALRGGTDLVFLGLGTGVGGAVVVDGAATCNLFAHHPGFSDRTCTCTRTGCLETVAAGWALPDPLPDADLPAEARAQVRFEWLEHVDDARRIALAPAPASAAATA